MSRDIQVGESVFKDIELIILDIGGTLIDYNELWLKQVGYLSQILAETHSTVQGELFRSRAMLMKVMGVDPESGTIDYSSCLFTSTTANIKAILSSILYLNNVSWFTAMKSVDDTLFQMEHDINLIDYTSLYPDTKDLLERLSNKFKLAALSKRSFEDSKTLLKHYKILENIHKKYSFFERKPEFIMNYENSILAYICQEQEVKYENTLIIADCVYDLCVNETIPVNRVLLNRNNLDNAFLNKYSLKNVVNTFKEIKLI